MKASFRKAERLCSRKEISELFTSGNGFNVRPFRVVWLRASEDAPSHLRVVMSVPKRKLRKAVDRNLIKRRMREAYRKHKAELITLLESRDRNVNLMLVYQSAELMKYREIEEKIVLILQRLKAEHAAAD